MYLHKKKSGANSTDLDSQLIFNCDNWTYLVKVLIIWSDSIWVLETCICHSSADTPLALEHSSHSCLWVFSPHILLRRPEQTKPWVNAYLLSCQEQCLGNTTKRHTSWGSHDTEKATAAACQYCCEILHNQPNTGSPLHLTSTVRFSCSLSNMITIFQSPNNFLQRNCRSHLIVSKD